MAASVRLATTIAAAFLCFLQVANAQTAASARGAGATISGVVYDSIAKAPLTGADIQLVDAANPAILGPTATSDLSGHYTLADVPDGRYKLGFFHPVLDSIGVDLPPRDITMAGRAVRADLAIPPPARIRRAVCGKSAAGDQGALVLGIVRDAADGSPAAGVSVTGEWMEIAIDKGGMFRRMPTRTAKTGDNGWFALCNVPSGGTMSLSANRGTDSTDRIEVDVPGEGFLRHELFIGSTRTVVAAAPARSTDSVARKPITVHYGNGRLTGTVIAGATGKPLAGAQVAIVGGPRVTANQNGEFLLTDAPMGTRMIEVRSLGYYPDRRRVDVVTGAPPVRFVLSTFKAVLDTVRIRSRRLADAHDSGFEERKRSGMGRYLTADDIAKRGAAFTSGVLRTIAGLRVNRTETGESIQMRGIFQNADWCTPEFYVDGRYMFTYDGEDLDAALLPKDIAAIEVYTESNVPPQFTHGLAGNGCGSIVIWTKG
ncbi:MAG TPA: carboxypeptidase regulatory-like domain-containing protein [Gemmatimonadaceae bacterium]|nr:carboxypeptidase regulatory-like domain-containing protein [Gemmatimonadaceae bacterium]